MGALSQQMFQAVVGARLCEVCVGVGGTAEAVLVSVHAGWEHLACIFGKIFIIMLCMIFLRLFLLLVCKCATPNLVSCEAAVFGIM